MMDAAQRGVLFWDVMRQRGGQYRDHLSETVPHVLDYKAELVMDGRTLKRPVNYSAGAHHSAGGNRDRSDAPAISWWWIPVPATDPGIGGFKADSEIGVAMKAGHPCYFIGFYARSDARSDH